MSLVSRSGSTLAALFLAQFLISLDGTIVVIALPSIQRDLGFDPGALTWVANAYIVMLGGFLLVGGRSADFIGRKRAFIAGMWIFTAASLMCGVAEDQWTLLAGRAIQGLGAAVVLPASLAIVADWFRDASMRRGLLAVWTGANSAGGGAALLLGAFLVDRFSWPMIFIVNVPLGAAVIVVTAVCMSDTASTARPAGLDWRGAGAMTAGSLSAVGAVISGGEDGWWSVETMSLSAAAVGLIGLFVAIERRRTTPLVPLGMFRSRAVVAANIVAFVIMGVIGTLAFLMTWYLQGVLGYSPYRTGAAFLAVAASLLCGSLMSHGSLRRADARTTLIAAMVVCGLGAAMLTRLSATGDYVRELLPALVTMSIGAGCALAVSVILATGSLPRADVGVASGVVNTAQQLGAAFWLAVFTSVAFSGGAEFAPGSNAELVHGLRDAFWGVTIVIGLTTTFVAVVLNGPNVHSQVGRRSAEGVT